MAKLSLREAVKRFDVSRPTLLKALNDGKVSGVKDGQGQWEIDPAELIRVYRPRGSEPDKADKPFPDNFPTFSSPLPSEIERLREQLAEAQKRAEVAEALAQERATHIEDLRRMLPPPSVTRKRWWPW